MTIQLLGRFLLVICLFSGAYLTGCSSTPDPSPSDSQAVLSGTDEQIFVGDSIEMNYDPNVIMKRAEAYFEKESYSEAIVEYKHFLDLHRNHVLASYAQYKIATSHYKRFKTVDRDPEPIHQALSSYQKLLTDFPNNRYETEAHEKMAQCHDNLAQHDLLVGQFYYKRESYLAAAHRFERIISTYPELDTAVEAMYHLASTYEKLGAQEWARDWAVKLVKNHQDHKRYDNGMQLLAKLQSDHPDLEVPDLTPPSPVAIAQASGLPPSYPRPSLNPSTFAAPQTTTLTKCSLGAWCDGSQSNPLPPTPSNGSNPTSTCRTGQWC